MGKIKKWSSAKFQQFWNLVVANYNKILLIFCGLILIEIVVQCAWPQNLTRPFIKIGINNFGLKNQEYLSRELNGNFIDSKIRLKFRGRIEDFRISEMGGKLDFINVQKIVFEYSIVERMIPFSLFWPSEIAKIEYKFDDNRLSNFINNYAKSHKIEPINAELKISEQGKAFIQDFEKGYEVNQKELKKEIVSFGKNNPRKEIVEVSTTKKFPQKMNKYFEQAKKQVDRILSKGIVFKYQLDSKNKVYAVGGAELSKWVELNDDGSSVKIEINSNEYKKFIQKINLEQEVKSGLSIVKMIDGVESSRKTGNSGSRVSVSRNLDQVTKYFKGEDLGNSFVLITESIPPTEKRYYSYTFSQTGLQAKINEIGRRYDVRISLQQLNGNMWGATWRGGEVTPSASTYKLFVALRLFKEIDDGIVTWDGSISGTPIKSCFYQMIIASTNACAESWLKHYSRSGMNNFIRSIGVSNATNFMNGDRPITTSAEDLRRTIAEVYKGNLSSRDNRNILLDHLARQQWRSGIPSGSKGRVYDKVGFLWNYVHDTAVVEHPRGTYSIAIMTRNANYATIAKITRELEAFMYP
jgi:beta-lactamase class A